jgi:hypothetical protein
MADWRVLAADLVTNTIKAEMPFEGFEFTRGLNGAGAFRAGIGQDHEKATATNLDPARTALYPERGNRIVWGGIMWPLRRPMGGRKITVEASDWVGWLTRRNIRHTLTFPATYDTNPSATIEQFDIVRGIVDYLQSIQDLGITVDTHNSGVLRRRKYPFYERKPAGEAISQLANVIDGFDYAAETSRDPVTDQITKHIRLYYPRRGRRTNHVFSWGTNIDDYSYTEDGARIENQVDAFGQGEEEGMLIATATDPNQWSSYPILDGTVDFRDVTEEPTLQGHADNRLRERKAVVELLDLKLKANALPSFSSWIPGDEVTVNIKDPDTDPNPVVDFSGFWRIMSDKVEVSKTGDETVTLRLTRPEVSLA